MAGCSVAPAPSSSQQAERPRATRAALHGTAQQIAGAYQVATVVSGEAVWRQLNLVADGSFNGFTACKVPACSQVRTFGAWDVDDATQTLTLTPKGGDAQSFALTVGWDGGAGIEIGDGTNDVQLSFVAATCTAASDCDGQPVLGGDQTCASGSSLQSSCDTNVCEASCVATRPIAQRGEHCGGFIMNAPVCAEGLTCILGFIPDTGGTCEPEGTPPSCATDDDCLDGQSCIHPDTQPNGAGRCVTQSAAPDHTCSQ